MESEPPQREGWWEGEGSPTKGLTAACCLPPAAPGPERGGEAIPLPFCCATAAAAAAEEAAALPAAAKKLTAPFAPPPPAAAEGAPPRGAGLRPAARWVARSRYQLHTVSAQGLPLPLRGKTGSSSFAPICCSCGSPRGRERDSAGGVASARGGETSAATLDCVAWLCDHQLCTRPTTMIRAGGTPPHHRPVKHPDAPLRLPGLPQGVGADQHDVERPRVLPQVDLELVKEGRVVSR